MAAVEQLLGLTYAAANGLVSRLAGTGILQEITGQKRHRVFRYAPYLDLFSAGPGPPRPNESAESAP